MTGCHEYRNKAKEEDFFIDKANDLEDYDNSEVIDISTKREAYAKLHFTRCYKENYIAYAFEKGRIGYYPKKQDS